MPANSDRSHLLLLLFGAQDASLMAENMVMAAEEGQEN